MQILTVLSSGILHRARFLQDSPFIQTYLFTYLTSPQMAIPALHPAQANQFISPFMLLPSPTCITPFTL